jgi:hypothetical protein
MGTPASIWLAADYHFPVTYSCRVPMSSANSALAMPAPGPGTVRLALIRTGIELFGIDYTRDELFPIIRAAPIRIKPPEQVTIFTQTLRGYKGGSGKPGTSDRLDESPIYREFAHATGAMTAYLEIPVAYENSFRELLAAIGYWGQASSLTYCTVISEATPPDDESAIPFEALGAAYPAQRRFSCFVSEFRDAQVKWEEVVPGLCSGKVGAIDIELYIWPMVIYEQRNGGTLLVRRSLL